MWSNKSFSVIFYVLPACIAYINVEKTDFNVKCNEGEEFNKKIINKAAVEACDSAFKWKKYPESCLRLQNCPIKKKPPLPIETLKVDLFRTEASYPLLLWPIDNYHKAVVEWNPSTGRCKGLGVVYGKPKSYYKCEPVLKSQSEFGFEMLSPEEERDFFEGNIEENKWKSGTENMRNILEKQNIRKKIKGHRLLDDRRLSRTEYRAIGLSDQRYNTV